MNRKQAKANGVNTYNRWVEGYNWTMENSKHIPRNECNLLMKTQFEEANKMTSMHSKAYIFGMAAAFRRRLKKGQYPRY